MRSKYLILVLKPGKRNLLNCKSLTIKIVLPQNLILTNQTVLITGAAGFIGSFLSLRLLSDFPNLKVVGVDNLNDYYDVKLKENRLAKLKKLVTSHSLKAV